MRQFYNYDAYIFDCDGVLLDSNSNKIEAMRAALESLRSITGGVEESISYFANNFGRSRYHHVKEFLNNHLELNSCADVAELEQEILERYAANVDDLYPKSPVIPGTELMLQQISEACFVASGSEQTQLQQVLAGKNLAAYFEKIAGSPTPKTQIVRDIVASVGADKNILMVGDSVADLDAARNNGIDFLGISEYSNTPDTLRDRCSEYGYEVIANWRAI